jgi:pimeloyl-ACP methyl ester carboxylesterase
MPHVSNVILVHGAWADGSAWGKVLPLLAEAGLNATAVQLQLSSLAEDVATLKRAIALIDGPTLLVAHSYGGAVITQGGDEPKVAGLVYITGFGPDVGESAASLGANGPPTSLPDNLRPDAAGFLKLTRAGVLDSFAQDLAPAEQALIFQTQGPIAAGALGGEITAPAWKQKPSWYLLAGEDHAIHPDLQKMMAERMGAEITRVASSHVAMLSHPTDVADLIVRAAQ